MIFNDDSKAPDLDVIHPRFRKFIDQAPKQSYSDMTVLSYEYLDGDLPVTRVALSPHTGRTHQLRVHMAALGFPILGDDIYGYAGEGDCGIDAEFLDKTIPDRQRLHRELFELQMPLCLHAKQLCLAHPLSGAPIIFQCRTPF
jgi:tRNA pseudouridine32 synthase / 23S rRNA pseudouridine746 synthase